MKILLLHIISLFLIKSNLVSLVCCLTVNESELDPSLVSNISEINEKLAAFDYERFESLDRGAVLGNLTEAEQDDLISKQAVHERLLATVVNVAAKIAVWFGQKYETSIFDNDQDIVFKVALSKFEEEEMDDRFNSPKTKVNIEFAIYSNYIALNTSIPLDKLDFKGHFDCRVDCQDLQLAVGLIDMDLSANVSTWCFVYLQPDSHLGYVEISEFVKVTLKCTKNFTAFPFDTMECQLPFTFSADHLNFKNSGLNFSLNGTIWQSSLRPVIDVNEYYLEDMKILEDMKWEKNNKLQWKWRKHKITWTLRRKHGYYIYTIYLPISLLVLISWMSFFLGNTYVDVQMRLALVVTILLTLVTVIQGLNQHIPKSPQYKASDNWSITSVAFVISAMVGIVANRAILWREKENAETAAENKNKEISITPSVNDIKPGNQDLDTEKIGDVDKRFLGFIRKFRLDKRDLVNFAKMKLEMPRLRKITWCVRAMNIFFAILFPLSYSYFAYTHIQRFCTFERFLDNRYFESVTDYDGPNGPQFMH